MGWKPMPRLALRELEATAGAGLAVLLTLDLAGVAGEEAGIAEGLLQRRVVVAKGAGDAEADGLGLAHESAAVDLCDHLELALGIGDFEWGQGVGAVPLFVEELLDGRAFIRG